MVTVRAFSPTDLDAVVGLSLQAWEPVFGSLRAVLGDPIFLRLHPDWRADQERAVRDTCLAPESHVLVADEDGPVGFVVALTNAYHQRMGAIEMIAVDPAHHRRGVAALLMAAAEAYLDEHGMDVVVVETGGDPGHAPARATYEAAGYTPLPIARYFRLLADQGR